MKYNKSGAIYPDSGPWHCALTIVSRARVTLIWLELRDHSSPPRPALPRQHLAACHFPRALHRWSVGESIVRIRRKCGLEPVADDSRKCAKIRARTKWPGE